MGNFDKWAILKIVELILVAACLVFKRVSDDEARSIFLYLQKLSREWGLLNSVTWDKVGSSVADATYGGYLIITATMLIGKLCGELPTERRIMEWVFLAVGAILFIVLGSLAFAAIDSVYENLVDNAAILGTLSVVTGALFLLDMGAPKGKKSVPSHQPPAQIEEVRRNGSKQGESQVNGDANGDRRRSITQQVYDIERDIERSERETHLDDSAREEERRKIKKEIRNSGIKHDGQRNGSPPGLDEVTLKESLSFPSRDYTHLDPRSKSYKQKKDDEFDIPRRFGIYGKDVTDNGTDTDETASIPPRIELHTPVWGNIRKDRAKKYTIPPVILPQRVTYEDEDVPERPPSGPLDPGYVQYTAQHWGESKREGTKTPRHSPTEV